MEIINGESILAIGVSFQPVRGGVAAVEDAHSKFISPYNHIATCCAGGKIKKTLLFVRAFASFLWCMTFCKKIRIVHIHGASYASFWRKRVFIFIARLFGKKIVYHIHGGKFNIFAEKHRIVVEKTIRMCDCIVVLSESWKDYFSREFPNVRVEIIHNAIDLPLKCKNRQQKFTMLFLGLLGQNKGIYDLLDVIAAHKAEFGGKLKLVIGGNGEVDKVKEIINKEDISNIVSYEGWISGSKKQNLYNMSDVLILPSYNEGLPMCILEALSYDIPVIATRVGGIPEIVKDGINGYLISPGDHNGIYLAIKKAIKNRDKTITGGVQSYFLDHVACDLNKLYHSL